MSQMALIGSPSLALQEKAPHRLQPPVVSGTWRFVRKEENIAGLSWVVAIAASFLMIGIVGLFEAQTPLIITFSGRAGLGASDTDSTELTMAELHAMEDVAEVVPQEVEVPPQVDLVEPLEIAQDLPELAEALVTEDVFTVPAAPRIEDALKPVDPLKPKPKPQPLPARPRPVRATTKAAGTQNGTVGSGGGAGGTGAVGAGNGGGRFPKPNYPSSARSRGVTGKITVSLSVSPAGRVENADAISSQGGWTSSEQDAVAGFVERNWRFPAGAPRRFTQTFEFKLNSR